MLTALEVIEDGKNGMLACSTGGWYRAIEELIKNPELRQTLCDRMKQTISREFDYPVQNDRFLVFLKKISISSKKNLFNLLCVNFISSCME